MSRLIDRIKDTLQGTRHEHNHAHDHEPFRRGRDAGEPEQAAPQAAAHEPAAEHEDDTQGHKHC